MITRRRLAFASASAVVLAVLVGLIASEVIRLVDAVMLFALWFIVGIVGALYRGLQAVRADIQRTSSRLEWTLAKDLRRADSGLATLVTSTHADFDGMRKLLDSVHQQTAARLSRLELAIDDATETASATIEERGRTTEQLLQSSIGLQSAVGSRPLPPMRAWAGFPDFLSYLYRLVRAAEPPLVVECGSGVSTVVIATALAQIGRGSLVSLEHDEWYASRTRSWLVARHLDNHAEVLVAPLGYSDVAPHNPWYQHAWVEDDPREIDLLVVDGPPGSTADRARYPAVPLLSARFSCDCVIVLDDVNRDDEREVLEVWEELLPGYETMVLPHVKGTGVLFPKDRGSVAPWID